MPAEEKDEESLQDLLRDLLASTTPEEARAPKGEEGEAVKEEGSGEPPGEAEAAAQPQPAALEERPPEEEAGTLPPPALEVESMATAVAPPPVAVEATPESQAPAPPGAGAEQALLEGKLEIRVVPPVPPARLALLERALRERGDLVWLGTWGKPKEGTSLRLDLKVPVTAADLFQGIDVVEWVEAARAGKAWLLKVSLAPDGRRLPEAEAPPVASPQPAAPQPSAPPAPGPAPTLTETPGGALGGQVDLEASPIPSLEALNRLERLLASLGGRTVNVLSLDGVSTVLVTLEGVGRETLARKLQEKISGIEVEVSQGRLIARFPEAW